MVRNGTFSIFLPITSRGLQAVKPYLNHWFPGFSSHSAQAPKVLCFLGQDGPHWWPISSPKWEYIYGKISRTTQTSAQRWPFGLLATGGQHHFLLEVSSIFYKISLFAFLKKRPHGKTSPRVNSWASTSTLPPSKKASLRCSIHPLKTSELILWDMIPKQYYFPSTWPPSFFINVHNDCSISSFQWPTIQCYGRGH